MTGQRAKRFTADVGFPLTTEEPENGRSTSQIDLEASCSAPRAEVLERAARDLDASHVVASRHTGVVFEFVSR